MKLFAMAPTITMVCIFFIKLLKTPILVEIFDPPIMHETGFSALFVSILITFTSSDNNLPA